MARPTKSTVDYFPHVTEHGKTLFVLENTWGNDGYATWFKILERLGASENHVIDLNDEAEAAYLAAYCKIRKETLFEILDQCSVLNAIHPGFWRKKLIYSRNFVENVADAYRNRKEKLPSEEKIKTIHRQYFTSETELMTEETPISDGNPTSETGKGKGKGKVYKNNKLFSSDSIEYGLANALLENVLEIRPAFKKPNLQTWADHIDKMIRIDKRDPREIDAVIEWCCHDPFWSVNILSTESLRKQYDKLVLKMSNATQIKASSW